MEKGGSGKLGGSKKGEMEFDCRSGEARGGKERGKWWTGLKEQLQMVLLWGGEESTAYNL